MSRVAELLERWVPNPWAIASREGRETRYHLLAEMAGKLLGNADPDAVLRMLIERAPEDLGLDVCLSYAADEEARMLSVSYAAGIAPALAELLRSIPYGADMCGTIAVTRRPLVVPEIVYNHDPAFALARRNGCRAYAGFPLLAEGRGGKLLGVLAFASRRIDRFTDSDLEFLASVASHVAAVRRRNLAQYDPEQRERQFRTLADTIPHLAWMARPNASVVWFNKRWLDYTGLRHEEAAGFGWQAIIHPDHLPRVVGRFREVSESGELWEDTFPMRRHDGEWRWFLSRAMAVRDDHGRVSMWFGTNTDVTEQRAVEQALRAARDEAERADDSKSRFLAAASHDLRQPMQSMLLMLSVLDGQVQSVTGRKALDSLVRGLDAMKGLLDGLLDVSRLDAGIIEPDVRDVAVADILERISLSHQPVAAEKGLAWEVAPTDAVVRTDPALLARILGNLAENAVRYTRKGGVRLSCHPVGDDALAIAITDTGIGIAPEHRDAIWEEFRQIGNPERDRTQGTGLGLAIVRRLANLLGHRVDLVSDPGKGSTFTVTVPRAVGCDVRLGLRAAAGR